MLCARKMMNRDYVSHRREGSLRKMWDAIKNTNMHIMGLPEGKDIAGAGGGTGRNHGCKIPRFRKIITYTSRKLDKSHIG